MSNLIIKINGKIVNTNIFFDNFLNTLSRLAIDFFPKHESIYIFHISYDGEFLYDFDLKNIGVQATNKYEMVLKLREYILTTYHEDIFEFTCFIDWENHNSSDDMVKNVDEYIKVFESNDCFWFTILHTIV